MAANLDKGATDATLARADVDMNNTTLRWRALLDGRSPSSFVWLVPFAIATAYLVVLVVQLPQIVGSLTWNSDVASAFTIPQTLVATGTGGHTVLSSTGEYVSLWFGLLTASLPLHRELWEFAAAAVLLVAALTIGWAVSQLANRRAAVLAVLLVLVVSPPAFTTFMAAFTHNIAYLGTALLGAYIVWMMRARTQRRVTVFAAPLIAGVLLGVCLASNLLLLVTGIVPFAFTAALGGLQRDRRARSFAISALATVAVALPTALLTSTIMGSLGFVIVRPSTDTVPLSALSQHAEYLFEGLKGLFGGYLADQQTAGTLEVALGIAADVVMALALLTLLALGAYTVARLIRSRLGHRGEKATPRDLATSLHIVYWTVSAASTAAAFELSVKGNGPHPQYYATLIFSVAAIAPLLMRRASLGRRLVPAGASILFAASLVGLTNSHFGPTPFGQDASEITRLAEANHATTGYAGYWYASDLTWNSREQVKARPVSFCINPAGVDLCPFYIARVQSWYVPAQRRTFVLVNPKEEYLSERPPGLGRPLAAYTFSDSTTMYIYPYDIGSRLGPAPD